MTQPDTYALRLPAQGHPLRGMVGTLMQGCADATCTNAKLVHRPWWAGGGDWMVFQGPNLEACVRELEALGRR